MDYHGHLYSVPTSTTKGQGMTRQAQQEYANWINISQSLDDEYSMDFDGELLQI